MSWVLIAPTCSADSVPQSGKQSIAQGATTATILFDAVDATYELFATPNWNTTVWLLEGSMTATQAVVRFGTPAPANAIIRWEIQQ